MRRRTAKLERRARLVTPDTLVAGIDLARALGGGHSCCGSFSGLAAVRTAGWAAPVAGIAWMSGIILASVTSAGGGGGRSGRTSRAAAGLAGPPR